MFASLVLSMAAATKKEKKKLTLWEAGTSSGHITNLKQSIWRLSISIFETNKQLPKRVLRIQ